MCNRKGLVSCVTPVYNGESHLELMLDSVLGQTYPWVEMILVDDGSTDRTLEIAESYREKFAGKGYSYQILHTPHQNASAAINCGLLQVTGEYLIWPDSDDILEPESIKKRVDFLVENPQYRCVRSIMYYFDSNGPIEKADEQLWDLTKENLFYDIIEFGTFVCCGCYMLKTREFFEIYPQRHIPEYPVGQNLQMLLPYMYRYLCHTIPERLYGVQVRPNSHSRRKLTRQEEEQKYRYFEYMMDELSAVCKLRSLYAKRRIACWKLKRRRDLALKYGQRREAAKLKLLLFLYGKGKIHKILLWPAKRFHGWKERRRAYRGLS